MCQPEDPKIKIKLVHFRNMVIRNVCIIMEIMNKVDALEACEQVRHECPLKSEVKIYKEDIDVDVDVDVETGRFVQSPKRNVLVSAVAEGVFLHYIEISISM